MRKHIPGLISSLFGCILVLIVIVVSGVSARIEQVSNFIQQLEAVEMSKIESTWTGSDGVERKVTTFRQSDESAVDFANRHKEEFEAMKSIYPPA